MFMSLDSIELCWDGAQRINWQEPSVLKYHIWYSMQLLGYTNLVLRTILLMCRNNKHDTYLTSGKILHVANALTFIYVYFCNKIAWWWFWWTETWNTLLFNIKVLSLSVYCICVGTTVAQWLRCCATNQKVAGLIPAGVIGIFHWHKILPIALWPWGRLSL